MRKSRIFYFATFRYLYALLRFRYFSLAFAHFSKYIKPGAVRIASSAYSPDLEITAAKNLDGTIVLVVMNTSEEDKLVNLRMNGTTTRLTFWGNSIAPVLI